MAWPYPRLGRNIWEHKHLEAVPLDDNNSNYFAEYRLSVDKKETALISDIKRLAAKVESDFHDEGWWPKNAKISAMTPNFHAYVPLFHAFIHLNKRYWRQHFWARGDFCVTAGELTKEMIKVCLE